MRIQKTTRTDRELNSNILTIMMYSFFDTNISSISDCLAEEGVFLGMSKNRFLGWLNTQFAEFRAKKIHGVGVHPGICLDHLPGAEVLEIKYALDEKLLSEGGVYTSLPSQPAREGEAILLFAYELYNGMVIRISRTERYKVKSLVPENELEIHYN